MAVFKKICRLCDEGKNIMQEKQNHNTEEICQWRTSIIGAKPHKFSQASKFKNVLIDMPIGLHTGRNTLFALGPSRLLGLRCKRLNPAREHILYSYN